jgi:hypothetical protein
VNGFATKTPALLTSVSMRPKRLSASATTRAARSIVAQLEGQVLFAKLLDDPGQLEATWRNCLALLGAADPGRMAPGAAGMQPR